MCPAGGHSSKRARQNVRFSRVPTGRVERHMAFVTLSENLMSDESAASDVGARNYSQVRLGGYVELSTPSPDKCEQCAKPCEPYASRLGWLCTACLPDEERLDEDGNRPPCLTAQERTDLQLIRERLAPRASRCDTCHERRASNELWPLEARVICTDCRELATRISRKSALKNTGLSEVPTSENAPGSTTAGDPGPHPYPGNQPPLDGSNPGIAT